MTIRINEFMVNILQSIILIDRMYHNDILKLGA